MSNIIDAQRTPFFLATLTTQVSTVTGDGTVYTPIWDTLSSGSGYNTSNGIFTCPIAGEYLFITRFHATGITSSHTYANLLYIATGGSFQTCDFSLAHAFTSSNDVIFTPSVAPIRMSVGDTVHVTVQVSNGTKVINFGTLSTFSGVRLP